MQDNGTAEKTGGATSWTDAPGFGDGGYALIDPHNNNNRYGENAAPTGGLGVVTSQDGFATSHDASTMVCGGANFMAPLALDPGTPTTLFAGGRDLCETTNANTAAPTWTDISEISAAITGATESGNTVTLTFAAQPVAPTVGDTVVVSGVGVAGYNGTYTITAASTTTLQYTDTTPGLANSSGGTAVTNVSAAALSAIAVSDAGGTKIYIADDSGHSYFSTNNGATWTSMDTGVNGTTPLAAVGSATASGPAPSSGFGLEVSGLAADPTNPEVVYATVNGFQGSSAKHVFKWTNTGGPNGTWTDISGTLPDEPYDCVVVNPAATNQIIVGGITGAFISNNDGTSWNQLGTGLPNVQVDGLAISPVDGNTLVAFTHGRSAWQLSTSPTAEVYSRFKVSAARGWTTMTWRSAQKVAGFNVYEGMKRLNRRLVTSRTSQYRFSIHQVVRTPRLAAIPLR